MNYLDTGKPSIRPIVHYVEDRTRKNFASISHQSKNLGRKLNLPDFVSRKTFDELHNNKGFFQLKWNANQG